MEEYKVGEIIEVQGVDENWYDAKILELDETTKFPCSIEIGEDVPEDINEFIYFRKKGKTYEN